MPVYRVQLSSAAERDLTGFSGALLDRLLRKIAVLEHDPRPPAAKILHGSPRLLRLRVGDYRIVYHVDDETRMVRVILIANRRDVYRKLAGR